MSRFDVGDRHVHAASPTVTDPRTPAERALRLGIRWTFGFYASAVLVCRETERLSRHRAGGVTPSEERRFDADLDPDVAAGPSAGVDRRSMIGRVNRHILPLARCDCTFTVI